MLTFIKKREEAYKNVSIKDILNEMCGMADIVYFSSRKVSSTRGGGIVTDSEELMLKMRDLIPLYEGFMTYGGMSVREIEAMAVGLRETLDETVIGQSPSFIEYAVNELDDMGIPVVMPAGALGCHIDALQFLPHVPQLEYSAGALAAALFIVSGAGEWNGEPFPWTEMPMATMFLQIWNCCDWLSQEEYLLFLRPTSCWTG